MIVYTVHEPPNPPADRIDRAEKLEFVRDGFQPLAAAIPPLWMAMNQLWMVLLHYLLVSMGASLVLGMLGVAPTLIALINLAANVIIGFEADRLRRWTLTRRGWSEIGTVTGKNLAECERRFFDGWLIQQPMLRPAGNRTGGFGTWSEQPHEMPEVPAGDGAEAPARSLWQRLLRR